MTSVPLIPRQLLFGNPKRFEPRLSPDGRRLAYLAPDEGVLNVWLRRPGEEDDRPVTHDRGRGIQQFLWSPDGGEILYVQDRDGDEDWHLYQATLEGADARDLTPFEGVQAQILKVEPEFPRTVLVALNHRDPRLHDVYRLDLDSGGLELDVRNDLGALGWTADHRLRVRVAQVQRPDGSFVLMSRGDAHDGWREILTWDGQDGLTTWPWAVTPDDRGLYMASSIGSNTAELRRLDLETGQQEALASDPEVDVGPGLLLHPTRHHAQAVSFYHHRQAWRVLDPQIEGDLDRLTEAHPGELQVASRDLADERWLVAYTQDAGPVLYYAYHRPSGEVSFLFSARPELQDLPLAGSRPVSIRARDGLALHGYLTLPPGAEPRGLPAVLRVHGGPWSRDFWGFNAEVQWLANRGYAVLQVNFRGSTGYGKAFLNAGDREWGARMLDDLSDAVAWLVEQRVADPRRVGVMGGSYGGYAVLAGLVWTPDLYACGVDIVGPSSLITLLKNIPPYWMPLVQTLYRRVGHPEEEVAFLESRSPLFHADRIRAPLLIAQGANDPRVKRQESLQIVARLRDLGREVEYLEFPDEGHGFVRPENRLKFYAAAERFLARHLGGRYEPP